MLCALGLTTSCSASTSPLPIEPMFEIEPDDVSLQVGKTYQFSAILFGDRSSAAPLSDVAWSSSDDTVATIDTRGLATAKHEGEVTIVGLRKGVTAMATLLVSDVRLTQIVVQPRMPSIAIGTTLQFVASGRYSDGSVRDVHDSALVWTAVGGAATVDPNGVATGIERGSATIKASVGDILGSSELRVTGVTLEALQVDPPTAEITPGAQLSLQVVGVFSDGSLQDLTTQMLWTSSAESVAIVSYKGIVHALSTGTAIVSASYGDMTVSMELTVSK